MEALWSKAFLGYTLHFDLGHGKTGARLEWKPMPSTIQGLTLHSDLGHGKTGARLEWKLRSPTFLGSTLHFDLAVWVKAKYVVEPRVDYVFYLSHGKTGARSKWKPMPPTVQA